MKTVCAWCFPGLRIIDGETVSHGICAKHRAMMDLEAACLTLKQNLACEYSPSFAGVPRLRVQMVSLSSQ